MRTTIVVAVLIGCLLPVAAFAKRAPTPAESSAIKAAVTAYIKNAANHAAPDNKIVKISVSTVDGHYAGASLKSVSGNSTVLLKGSGRHWKVIGFGSNQSCSLAPKKVRADLGVTCGVG